MRIGAQGAGVWCSAAAVVARQPAAAAVGLEASRRVAEQHLQAGNVGQHHGRGLSLPAHGAARKQSAGTAGVSHQAATGQARRQRAGCDEWVQPAANTASGSRTGGNARHALTSDHLYEICVAAVAYVVWGVWFGVLSSGN